MGGGYKWKSILRSRSRSYLEAMNHVLILGVTCSLYVKLPTLIPNKRLNSELKSDDQMFGHGHGTVSIWSCRVCTLLLLSYPVKQILILT